SAEVLDRFTIRPQPALTMYCCTARDTRNAPRRCTDITASQSSTVILNSRLSRMIPALLTSTDGSPSPLATRATAACTADSSPTSAPTASARPPSRSIASTTRLPAASSRSSTATAKPSAASRFATPAPIPRAAPVTMAVRVVMRWSPRWVSGGTSGGAGQGHAAVDDQELAGDPAGVGGEQERHRAGDVGGDAEPLQRVGGGHLVLAALVELGGEPRLHHGGGDGVDPDIRGQLDPELLGDVGEHRLARAVEADPRGWPGAGDRGHVDDRAAVLAHPRAVHVLGPRERGEAVDLEDLAGGPEVQLDHRAVHRVDAGVVDQQVRPAGRRDRPPDGLGLVVGVVGPAGDAERVLRAAELRHGGVERPGVAAGDDDARAAVDQALRDGEPDPAARPGHDRGPAREPRAHASRSSTIAMPWPPPTHIVSSPYRLSWNCSEWISVVVIRAPVIPNG